MTGIMFLAAMREYYTPLFGKQMTTLTFNALYRSIPYGSDISTTAEGFRDYILNLDDGNLDDIRGIGKAGKSLVHGLQDDLADEKIFQEIQNIMSDDLWENIE